MSRPEDRYHRDPVFHHLVDMLARWLEENAMRQFTPTELREAVMLAACMYEMRHVRPLILPKDSIDTRIWEDFLGQECHEHPGGHLRGSPACELAIQKAIDGR